MIYLVTYGNLLIISSNYTLDLFKRRAKAVGGSVIIRLTTSKILHYSSADGLTPALTR